MSFVFPSVVESEQCQSEDREATTYPGPLLGLIGLPRLVWSLFSAYLQENSEVSKCMATEKERARKPPSSSEARRRAWGS